MTRRNYTQIFGQVEPGRVTRKRMAETIARFVTGGGAVTEDDLRRAGFSEADIKAHYAIALDQSGVKRLEGTL